MRQYFPEQNQYKLLIIKPKVGVEQQLSTLINHFFVVNEKICIVYENNIKPSMKLFEILGF